MLATLIALSLCTFSFAVPSPSDARTRVQSQWKAPTPDSVRSVVRREYPELADRPSGGAPVLVLLLTDSTGRVSGRKQLPLLTGRVMALSLLEKEFALERGRLLGASVMILEGPEQPARGSVWAVYGQTR